MAKKSKKKTGNQIPRSSKKELEKLFLEDFEKVSKQKPRKSINTIDSEVKKKYRESTGRVQRKRNNKGTRKKKVTQSDFIDRLVITKIRSERTGKWRLNIIDSHTGKKISIKDFKKKYNLSDSEIRHLESKDVTILADETNSGNVNKYFKFFNEQRNFSQLIDTKNLSDIEKYKIVYNGKKISFSKFIDSIQEYEEEIQRDFYKFMLYVKVYNGIAYIKLDDEIITIQDDPKIFAYTDKNKNFILFSSD